MTWKDAAGTARPAGRRLLRSVRPRSSGAEWTEATREAAELAMALGDSGMSAQRSAVAVISPTKAKPQAAARRAMTGPAMKAAPNG